MSELYAERMKDKNSRMRPYRSGLWATDKACLCRRLTLASPTLYVGSSQHNCLSFISSTATGVLNQGAKLNTTALLQNKAALSSQ